MGGAVGGAGVGFGGVGFGSGRATAGGWSRSTRAHSACFLRAEAARAAAIRATLPLGSRTSAVPLRRHAAGDALGLGARAPEGVEAVGALDRPAGVLRDPQAVGLGAVEVEEHRRAQRDE